MRKFIATLLFILWPGLMLAPAQQAIFFSQNANANTPSTSISIVGGTTFQAESDFTGTTPSYSCTPGNALYIVVASGGFNDTFTVTGTKETPVRVAFLSGPTILAAAVYTVLPCVGGAGTFSATTTVSAFVNIDVIELAHVTGVDAFNTCSDGQFSANCAITATTTHDFVIGSMVTEQCTPSNLDGWPNVGQSGEWGKLQTASGLITMHMSSGCSSPSDVETVVAFK